MKSLGLPKHTTANDKTKYVDDPVKHKVKILKRVSCSLCILLFKNLYGLTENLKFLDFTVVHFHIYFSTKNEGLLKMFCEFW